MHVVPCPCASPADLPELSARGCVARTRERPSLRDYYRCASGYVWNRPKKDPNGPIWFVTEVPTRPTVHR